MSHLVIHRVITGYSFPTEFRGYFYSETSRDSAVMHFRHWDDIMRFIDVMNPRAISISDMRG